MRKILIAIIILFAFICICYANTSMENSIAKNKELKPKILYMIRINHPNHTSNADFSIFESITEPVINGSFVRFINRQNKTVILSGSIMIMSP